MSDERFWALVDKSGECWVWTGCTNRDGYGRVTRQRRVRNAHRYSFEMANGSVPEGLTVDHLCGNRACVKPDHLEAVTLRENIRRSSGPAGLHARATECKSGHPFSPENTRVDSRGWRVCLACKRDRPGRAGRRSHV